LTTAEAEDENMHGMKDIAVTGRVSRPGRWAGSLGLAIATLVAVGGCDFEVTNPGPVDDSFLNDPGAHEAVVEGASLALSLALAPVAHLVGEVTKEISRSGANYASPRLPRAIGQMERIDTNDLYWNFPQRARWVAEDASRRFEEVLGASANDSYGLNARAKLLAGFAYRLLGENMCEGVLDGSAPQDRVIYFQRAEQRFSEAIEVAQRAGNLGDLVTAARAGRASVRGPGLGDWAGAVTDARQVPLGFVHEAVYGLGTQAQYNNLHWLAASNPFRELSAARTFADTYYRASGDPRVAWTDQGFGLAAYSSVPFYKPSKYGARDDGIRLASGSEMRLIEAEAALRGGSVQGAMQLINEIRATLVSDLDGSPLPTLSATTTQEAWTHLKHERGVDLWLEGRRMFDYFRWIADGTPGAMEDMSSRVRLCIPITASEVNTNPNIPSTHQDPVNPTYSGG
jgi:starch-binding outer membrane protein, SusD/RagB family